MTNRFDKYKEEYDQLIADGFDTTKYHDLVLRFYQEALLALAEPLRGPYQVNK